jgi:hypothetical protein
MLERWMRIYCHYYRKADTMKPCIPAILLLIALNSGANILAWEPPASCFASPAPTPQTHWEPPASCFASPAPTPQTLWEPPEIVAAEKARQAHIAALKRDLDAAIHDLNAWFPKRTKVEDYNVIDLTATAILQSGGGNLFRELLQRNNNPYGLTEGDIVGIKAASARNTPADTHSLERKIDQLSYQNERLQDQVRDARDAASDARMEASDANREILNTRLYNLTHPRD